MHSCLGTHLLALHGMKPECLLFACKSLHQSSTSFQGTQPPKSKCPHPLPNTNPRPNPFAPQVVLSKIRNAARSLLQHDEKDPKRIFEGQALMRRLYKYGLLNESQDKLDYALALVANDMLERRLQTLVFKQGLAKSIHHARVLIRQKHIR